MAKKKTQFNKAKYKDGVLSYNYLGGKGGKGGGNVSIKKVDEDWYFVDDKGEVKTNVGIKGKLTPTHMQNLENDGIFAAAEIKPDGTQLSKAEIKAGPEGGYSSNAGDSVGIDSSGNVTDGSASPIDLEKSNLSLAPKGREGELTTSNFNDGRSEIRSDVSNSSLSGSSANSPVVANPNGYGNYKVPSAGSSVNNSVRELNQSQYKINPSEDFDASSSTVTDPNLGNYSSNPSFNTAPSLNMQNSATPVNVSNVSGGSFAPPYAVNENSPQTNYPISTSPDTAFSPSNTATGFSGGNNSNMPMDYSSGSDWSPSAESATPGTTPGITDKKDGGWGAADWNAAGSVMKGVGGLYGAWTGMKNYQLARDAHNAQKNQWQANYDQQLKAYGDNKKLANQEIDARNRTLAARGQGTAQDPIISHI